MKKNALIILTTVILCMTGCGYKPINTESTLENHIDTITNDISTENYISLETSETEATLDSVSETPREIDFPVYRVNSVFSQEYFYVPYNGDATTYEVMGGKKDEIENYNTNGNFLICEENGTEVYYADSRVENEDVTDANDPFVSLNIYNIGDEKDCEEYSTKSGAPVYIFHKNLDDKFYVCIMQKVRDLDDNDLLRIEILTPDFEADIHELADKYALDMTKTQDELREIYESNTK